MSDRAVCTIVTPDYLPAARTLARSLARTDPGVPFFALVADRGAVGDHDVGEVAQRLSTSDLADPTGVERMAFYYTPFEFCNALRPHLHEYFLRRTEFRQWVYLDADILALSSISPVFDELERAAVLLSPHSTTPLPPALTEVEASYVHGIYNSGFLGVSRGPEAESFVGWFKDRLAKYCLSGENGQFVDQLWLNLVPLYFPGSAVSRHPGANVGHWNLHERRLEADPAAPGGYTANGQPVLFVHFSGWDSSSPREVSPRYAKWYRGKAPPAWQALGERYRDLLLAEGLDPSRRAAHGLATFDDGSPITYWMRRLYYRDVLAGNPGDGSPFARADEFKARARVPLLTRARRAVHGALVGAWSRAV